MDAKHIFCFSVCLITVCSFVHMMVGLYLGIGDFTCYSIMQIPQSKYMSAMGYKGSLLFPLAINYVRKDFFISGF